MPYALDRLGRPAALRALAGAVLMLSFGLAAGDAAAQTGNRPAPAQAQPPATHKPDAAQSTKSPVDARLVEIRKQLSITAAQQSQFDQFADIVKQNAQAMGALMQKEQQNAQQNAVEGLRTAASFAQAEADNLKRLVPALEALYAGLSDQQKRTADRLFNTAPPAEPPSQGRRRG